jgi:transposase
LRQAAQRVPLRQPAGEPVEGLVHDGLGIWLAARRLHQGRFTWQSDGQYDPLALTHPQLEALVVGLPWQRIDEQGIISLL